MQGCGADWYFYRREMVKRVSVPSRERSLCSISFQAMEKRQRERARQPVLLRPSKRVERARAARSEREYPKVVRLQL